MIHGLLGEYEYRLFEVSPENLDAFLTAKQFEGLNVTIPYKQTVIPYCDDLSDEARAIGSVNTIVKEADGSLVGYNTDYYGFLVMMDRAGISPEGKKALVLGDGGSARTVRYALAGSGAREIVTISRRGENHYGNLEQHYDAEIIVNTTPVGTYPGNGESLLTLKHFPQLCGVADLIYNPLRTKLILQAEELRIPHTNGFIMLAAQGELASRLFTKGPSRPWLADDIAGAINNETRNIALIGMPGCGKSTAAKILADKTGRPLIDIDALIEKASGKTIPAIFSEKGEEAFRRLETDILTEESKKSGAVIAAGGGVVTRPENRDLLRQNSLVVYLARDLNELDTVGRPLSLDSGIQKLAKTRLHLYEAWSDITVLVSPDPEQTVIKILEVIA